MKNDGYSNLDRSNNMNFLPALISALMMVESSNNPEAVGDGGRAVGILQIHRICVDDVKRIYGTAFRWPSDAKDPEMSKQICQLYLRHYLKFVPNPSACDAARIWNGGPHGNLERATVQYWQRVKPHYEREVTNRARMLALK